MWHWCVAFLLIFFPATFSTQAQAPLSALQKTSIGGKDYIRITQWAFANKFKLQWIINEKQLRATNANARMEFEIDSRRARINGINFSLSLPVLFQNNTVYISAADLQYAIHPILFPEKNPAGSTIRTICLDPGHGGRDPGNLDGRNQEKHYTLLLAAELEQLLKQSGFQVISTRQRESDFLNLDERPGFANAKNADLFISLHYNAAGNRNVQGTEIYCLAPAGTSSSNGGADDSPAPKYPSQAQNGKNILLAYEVQKSLVTSLKVEDRGVKRSQFVVLFNPHCPAILIEAGFMTHSEESKRIYDADYRKRMARAIVNGISSYQRIVER